MSVLTARDEEKHGHAPGERAAYALGCQAADHTRPPKRTELLSLTELRKRWRTSAIQAFGADVVLIAEARHHLSYALRGRPHHAGLDEQNVQRGSRRLHPRRPVAPTLGRHEPGCRRCRPRSATR